MKACFILKDTPLPLRLYMQPYKPSVVAITLKESQEGLSAMSASLTEEMELMEKHEEMWVCHLQYALVNLTVAVSNGPVSLIMKSTPLWYELLASCAGM